MSTKTTVNVTVSNSTVGILNTGDLASISAINSGLTILGKSGHVEIAVALQDLAEAILQDQNFKASDRTHALETLEELVRQAALPPPDRLKRGALSALLTGISSSVGLAGNAASIWSTWGEPIKKFFGL